jgi:rod shape-determining protein MreD
MNWLNSILILLAAFVAVFLESVCNGPRHWFGAQIDLLPSLMVYASLSSRIKTITLLAVLGGLWFDTLSANPLGVSMLPLLVPGYLIYARRELILRDQFFARFVLGLVASAMTPVLTLLLLSVTRQMPVLTWMSLWQWIVMSLGGGLLTPVCFLVFDGLNNALTYRPIVENSFRLDREIRRGRN